MKPATYIITLLTAALTFSACTKDEPIFPQSQKELGKPQEEKSKGEEPAKPVFLDIRPLAESYEVVTRSGQKTYFVGDDRIGVYVTSEKGEPYSEGSMNIQATMQGSLWKLAQEVALKEEPASIQAYYPYSENVENREAMPVEIASQTDYLYSIPEKADKRTSQTYLRMKHALSALSIQVDNKDAYGNLRYKRKGEVTQVSVVNVPVTGTMNILTGKVTPSSELTTYNKDVKMQAGSGEWTGIIQMPIHLQDIEKDVLLKVVVDGRTYAVALPKDHVWEPGKDYKYTIRLPYEEDKKPDLELDVEYWTNFGKHDKMQIIDEFEDYGDELVMSAENDSYHYGKIVVTGEAAIFNSVIYKSKNNLKGKFRYAFYKDGKIAEQYPAYHFQCTGFTTLFAPCFVTLPEGDYQLRLLVQLEGTSEWVIPFNRESEHPEDWNYHISRDNSTPSIRRIGKQGEDMSVGGRGRRAKLNETFNVDFLLTNRARLPLKGEIKAVLQRTFDGVFCAAYLKEGLDDKREWADEIGRISINLPASQKEWTGVISCKVTIPRFYWGERLRYGSDIYLYYKANGSNIWKLMRVDADNAQQERFGTDKFPYVKDTNCLLLGLEK